MLRLAPDPAERAFFIDYFPSWCGDVKELAGSLESTDDEAFRSGMCLCLGRLAPNVLGSPEQEALGSLFAKLYRNAGDTGTHGAAGWALRHWGIPTPRVEATRDPVNEQKWYVNKIGLTMLKILPDPQAAAKSKVNERKVLVTRPFYLCDREVSVDQFRQFQDSPNSPARAWKPSKAVSPTGRSPCE